MQDFYYAGDLSCKNFFKFAMTIKKGLDKAPDIAEKSKHLNNLLFRRLQRLTNYKENEDNIGLLALRALRDTPRYMYRKHLFYNGKEYEAEIDLLERKFYLYEV